MVSTSIVLNLGIFTDTDTGIPPRSPSGFLLQLDLSDGRLALLWLHQHVELHVIVMRRVLHVHVKVLARVHVEKGGATVRRRLAPSSHGRGEGRLTDDFPDLRILEELTEDGVG